jgi:hypothetical protein
MTLEYHQLALRADLLRKTLLEVHASLVCAREYETDPRTARVYISDAIATSAAVLEETI